MGTWISDVTLWGICFLFGWSEGWANSFIHKPIYMCDYYMVDIMLDTSKQRGEGSESTDCKASKHKGLGRKSKGGQRA